MKARDLPAGFLSAPEGKRWRLGGGIARAALAAWASRMRAEGARDAEGARAAKAAESEAKP